MTNGERFSKAAVRAWTEREKVAANENFRAITGNNIDPREGAIQADPSRWAATERAEASLQRVRHASYFFGRWTTALYLEKDLEDGRVVE